MKIYLFFIYAFLSIPLLSQAQFTTHLMNIAPSSKADSIALQRLVTKLNDENTVKQALLPYLKLHKQLRGEVFIVRANGSHRILYFGANKPVLITKHDSIQMRSKGLGNPWLIEKSEDFELLPDSLVALDTLKLNIHFTNHSYNQDKYYIEILLNGKLLTHDLPILDHEISIAPQWFNSGDHYAQIVLRNHNSPVLKLWAGSIYFLNQEDREKIQAFKDALQAESLDASEAEQALLDFVEYNYGKTSSAQIINYLKNE